MQFLKFFFLLITLPFFTTIASASLSPLEQQISNAINASEEEQLLLLEKLVNINSGTMNTRGIKKVGEILKPLFEQLGFKTAWSTPPATLKRAPTLIAKHLGKEKGKRLLLIGHLDTVFAAESNFQRFTKLSKNNQRLATGPGVIDDKGGIVVILSALKALKAAGVLDNINITVILTGDEENAGQPISIARKALFDAAKTSDIALDFEWSFTNDTATIARRGISTWVLQTTGKEAHSSAIFKDNVGYGAVYELTRILNTIQTELSSEKNLSINPAVIIGGTKISYDENNSTATAYGQHNVVAQEAQAQGDLRFLTIDQKQKAMDKMKQIVADNLPGTRATITFEDHIPNMAPREENTQLLNLYSEISKDLGYGAVTSFDPGNRGAADVSYIAHLVNGALAGLGPVGTGAHSVNETLFIDSLKMQAERAALLIYRLNL